MKIGPALFGNDTPTEEARLNMREDLDREVNNLETYWKSYGGEYLHGDNLTLADINIYTYLHLAVKYADYSLDDWPDIQAWYNKMDATNGAKFLN